jgi:hypothetical protein
MDVLLCHPNSPFRECLDQCDRYNRHAPREPILITGETGTGKELIVQAGQTTYFLTIDLYASQGGLFLKSAK